MIWVIGSIIALIIAFFEYKNTNHLIPKKDIINLIIATIFSWATVFIWILVWLVLTPLNKQK